MEGQLTCKQKNNLLAAILEQGVLGKLKFQYFLGLIPLCNNDKRYTRVNGLS